MSTWTKVVDKVTSITKVADVVDTFVDVADDVNQWASFGGLLYLATEARVPLTNEAEDTYIVISKGSDGVTYTDVDDVATSYTKVIDA